jgi:hypothetical protein
MSKIISADLIRRVWEYPLFEALYGRRTRRFGLGFEMTAGPYPYKSARPPIPLSEAEEALLVAAGIGFSGMALWDQSRPLPYPAVDGRTFPSTSHGRHTALFFTNDQGVFVIEPMAGSSDRMRYPGNYADQAETLNLYQRHKKKLQEGRLKIPRRTPPLCGHNLWDSNMPGATLFLPICDVSYSLIGLIAQFVDSRLERFAANSGRGMQILDDRFEFRPAGTEAWTKSGFLDPENAIPLSHLERQACYFIFSEPAMICQNMFLATEAIGLGGWMHCGILSQQIFAALGFRSVNSQKKPGLSAPIGLDGVFEACCPPYFPNMDDAVDAVLAPMLPPKQISASSRQTLQPAPYRISDAQRRAGAVAVSEEGIACTKAVCNYIYETYGRFPGTVDAMHLMWLMQVHHIDVEFYDRFYQPGAYTATHANHMPIWHPDFGRS